MRSQTKIDISSRLVFIVGCPRSGTSWVWGLITSLPNCVPLLIEDFPGIKSVGGVEKMYLGDGKFRTTETTIFFSNLSDEAIVRVIEAKLKKFPNKIFVEKTPTNAFILSRILNLFPAAKIIHVIRDPRATISSMIYTQFVTGFKFAADLEEGISLYRKIYMATEKFSTSSNYVRIKYENLLTQGKETLEQLADFIGIKDISSKNLTKALDENRGRVKSIQKNLYRIGKIDSYIDQLSGSDISEIEKKLFEIFQEYGYTLNKIF